MADKLLSNKVGFWCRRAFSKDLCLATNRLSLVRIISFIVAVSGRGTVVVQRKREGTAATAARRGGRCCKMS